MDHSLQQRLDAYVFGQISPNTLAEELSAQCVAVPSSAWEVLALIDQYHRRGKLPTDLFERITRAVKHRALGVHFSGLTSLAPPESAGGQASANEPRAFAAPEPAAAQPLLTSAAAPAASATEVALLRQQLHEAHAQAARYLEQLQSGAWQRPTPAPLPRRRAIRRSPFWRRGSRRVLARSSLPRLPGLQRRAPAHGPARSVQLVALLCLLLAVAAPPELGQTHGEEGAAGLRLAPGPVHIPAPGKLNLAAERFVAYPERGSADIEVQRSGGTDGAVSFVWWTRSAGARAGQDFRASGPRRVTLPAGVESAHLTVPILRNRERRHTELFYVMIGKPEGGARLGESSSAPVFIMRP